jgi:dolichyl-phosphate-mannose-protein mannosyltransferase
MSVKFVGLFTVLYIGLRTISELWEILGDISRPIVSINGELIVVFQDNKCRYDR